MSQNEQKTAIKLAEEMLEKERKEKLQREVYEYLKAELDSIDDIDKELRDLNTQKKVHEENIKNIKQGNLEAIEKRRQSFGGLTISSSPITGTWGTYSLNGGGGTQFYNNFVAGVTYTTGSGKTYIF